MFPMLNSAHSLSSAEIKSPKRKHHDLVSTTQLGEHMAERTIRYQSPALAEERLQESGCDSPRSRVAQRLGSLDIRADSDHHGSPSPRKRVKIDTASSHNTRTGRSIGRNAQSGTIDSSMRVSKRVSSGDRSLSPRAKDSNTSAGAALAPPPSRRYRSPPPPQLQSMHDSTSADVNALTWQVSEITGTDIDVQAGDDGEGINGIGFRPSPQMAYAKRQKRKQQIESWRMREARDARQKRLEKRNGCKLQADGGGRKRSVRFAELL
ncbi:hypothetical protein AMS68_005672 [Peltaster fructicola]|uniref:Uncharacterized protein n=1 Tax=Peltaster fructicola TaxID=286661 RepID=A0A6H0XZR3_9PEZI|nr:hypothetical protein AMS68_005672 [Peltaster fructicola]